MLVEKNSKNKKFRNKNNLARQNLNKIINLGPRRGPMEARSEPMQFAMVSAEAAGIPMDYTVCSGCAK